MIAFASLGFCSFFLLIKSCLCLDPWVSFLLLFLFSPLPHWERWMSELLCGCFAAGHGQPTTHNQCVHRQCADWGNTACIRNLISHISGGFESAIISPDLYFP